MMTKKPTAQIDLPALQGEWSDGVAMLKICTHFSITYSRLTLLRSLLPLPDRKRIAFEPAAPTPAQISVRAAAIRSAWSEAIELSRRVVKPAQASTAEINLSGETDEHYWSEDAGGDQ